MWWKVVPQTRGSERRHAVYARVSTLEGPPELMDEGLRQAREVVLPQGRLMEGFKGIIVLGDRQSGKTLGITFWESEEAMRASEEAAKRLREESAAAGGDTIASGSSPEVSVISSKPFLSSTDPRAPLPRRHVDLAAGALRAPAYPGSACRSATPRSARWPRRSPASSTPRGWGRS
jgi:heme-degrading monooxygenase HmoA